MENLALLIPILGVCIPIVAVVMQGKKKIAEIQLEETRLRVNGGGEGSLEVEELRSEMAEFANELNEVQERLDFTERLLAQSRARDELTSGPNGG